MSGVTSITGDPDPNGSPYRAGLPICDIVAGMSAARGILAARLARQQTGRGQPVETTLLGATVAALANLAGSYLVSGEAPPRFGNSHLQIAPYDLLHTSDGYANMAVGNDAIWRRFCKVLDLEELLADERFTTNGERVHNRPALLAAIEARTTQLTTAELLARMDEAAVPAGPIRGRRGVFQTPQAQCLALAGTQKHPPT